MSTLVLMAMYLSVLRELDGNESSFPGLNRRQPVKCVGAPELPLVIPAPAFDGVAADDSTG